MACNHHPYGSRYFVPYGMIPDNEAASIATTTESLIQAAMLGYERPSHVGNVSQVPQYQAFF
ncbi:MAG: hypothetical protein AB2792_15650 [Candidatus Thiodiazotropha sp.]